MVHRRYGAELKESIKALAERFRTPEISLEPFNLTRLINDILAAKHDC
jgi:hypothetical protein